MVLEEDPNADLSRLAAFINENEIATRLFLGVEASTQDPKSKNEFTFSEGEPAVSRPKVQAQRIAPADSGAAIRGIICTGIVNLTAGPMRVAVYRAAGVAVRLGGQDALSKLWARAKADVGVLSTADDFGTDHGNLGCADAVARILHDELGFSLPKTLSTDELYDELRFGGWTEVELRTPGAVIVSPSSPVMHGHTGIVGEDEVIYSNSSATGLWAQNWTVDRWVNYYVRCGSYAFAPPAQAVQSAPIEGPTGFSPLGAEAPIKGIFSISPTQMRSLCTGRFGPYDTYVDAIVGDGLKYGINPLFVLADFANQGVSMAYRNPWGISTDNYPYGPGGEQLGRPNSRIKNGPRSFSEDEWRVAFDRQFDIVSGPKNAKAKTVAEWATIDAPAGAENDVNGTNAQEAADVGALYNQLVAKLRSIVA
jgi:hypothetical protein